MNEEGTGKCLRQVEHIRGHFWHIYSVALKPTHGGDRSNVENDDFNFIQ
jgi:hypothetical protein